MKLQLAVQFLDTPGDYHVKMAAFDVESPNPLVVRSSAVFKSLDEDSTPIQFNTKAMSPAITFGQLSKINTALVNLVLAIEADAEQIRTIEV